MARGTMTVKQLISALTEYPDNELVFVSDDGEFTLRIDDVARDGGDVVLITERL